MIGNISKSKAQKGDPLTFDMLTEAEKASLSPKPDWNQTDETKADFIKNKPDLTNDSALDENSENPVQNKVITNTLNSQKYYGDMNIVPTDSSLFEFDGFNENDLSVEIYGFSETNDIEELVIPYGYKKDEITYRVSQIAPNAFENNTFIKTVVFPSNLDAVTDYAFGGCTNLEKAVFSKGNKGIWDAAFSNCTNLKTIAIPTTITTIYEKAFDGSGLTDVYYEGTKEQWESINISENNETLLNATIHFNWATTNKYASKDELNEYAENVDLHIDNKAVHIQNVSIKEESELDGFESAGVFVVTHYLNDLRSKADRYTLIVTTKPGDIFDTVPSQTKISNGLIEVRSWNPDLTDSEGLIVGGWLDWTSISSGGGGNITVDSVLDENSENPVQNKVVAKAFGNMGDTITTIDFGELDDNSLATFTSELDDQYLCEDGIYILSYKTDDGAAVGSAILWLVHDDIMRHMVLYHPLYGLMKRYEYHESSGNSDTFSDWVSYATKTDYATNNTAGVVKAYDGDHGSYGVKINSNGKLQLDCAYGSEIRAKASQNSPITPAYADVVVHSATHKEMSDDYDVSTLTLCAAENGKQGQYPASYDATKGYVDSKIGDIETALDGIIKIQNGILGVGVNE